MNQIEIDARQKIIDILIAKITSKDYKFILSANPHGSMIELRVMRKTFKNFQILSMWSEIRSISGEDYSDILYKIEKYPKYIETETEVKFNESKFSVLD